MMKPLLTSLYKHHLLVSICMAAGLMILLMLTPVSASASTKQHQTTHKVTIHRTTTIHRTLPRRSIYLHLPVDIYGLPLPILGPLPVFGPYPYYPPYPYSYPDPDSYPYFPFASSK